MNRPFTDRCEAGRVLADRLKEYAGRPDVIVLGLPRGRSSGRLRGGLCASGPVGHLSGAEAGGSGSGRAGHGGDCLGWHRGDQ